MKNQSNLGPEFASNPDLEENLTIPDFIVLDDLGKYFPATVSLGITTSAIMHLHRLGMVPLDRNEEGVRGMHKIWVAGLIEFYSSGDADTYLVGR